MAVQPRSRQKNPDQETLELLKELIESPPAPRVSRPAPVSLRSIDQQRDYALRGFLRRNWVDYLLTHAERLLIIAAVLVFSIWFVDGPVRDWLYVREAAARVSAIPLPTPAPLGPTAVPPDGRVTALLPFTSPDMAAPPEDGFHTPRQSNAAAPLDAPKEPTHLLVPALALDTPVRTVGVVDGVWEVADYAAGYMQGTALPGDNGNTALAGHAGLRGAVFKDLHRLNPGDDVYLDAGGWRFHYRVRESTSVWPNQVEVLESRGKPELTLITCTNWDTQRLVVVADLLDSTPSPGD